DRPEARPADVGVGRGLYPGPGWACARAGARARWRRHLAVLDLDDVGRLHHLDEGLAGGQRHQVAGGVVEQGRRGQRLLAPRALDRVPVRGDPGDPAADDLRLETVMRGVVVEGPE